MVHSPDILSTIGGTPTIRLRRIPAGLSAEIWVKLEMVNPGGSVKDRIAWSMIRQAEIDGRLTPGMTVVEATSGNTGIGLAMVCAARGYSLILTMPDTMSIERRAILTRRGADIRLSAGAEGMAGAIQLANRLATDPRRVFMPRQFDNPANPAIHLRTTGPEIDAAMNGRIDWFVAGVGTGGTITGAGTYLRTRHPQIQVIAVEPAESPVLSGGRPGVHGIQGLGAGFIPSVLAVELIDEIVTVTTEQALCMARRLAREEGIFTGPSGGAAVHAAWMAAQRADVDGHRIVTVAPDSGERYLSLTETDGGTEA